MSTAVEYPSDTSMRFTRHIQAPRAMVWRAWADLEQVAKWWGPKGFTTTTYERNFSVGGIWRYTMHGPDGTDYSNLVAYIEIEEPSRIVYDHGSDEDPKMFHVSTEFSESDTGTKIVTLFTFRSQAERDQTAQFAVAGHASTMERLEELLAASA